MCNTLNNDTYYTISWLQKYPIRKHHWFWGWRTETVELRQVLHFYVDERGGLHPVDNQIDKISFMQLVERLKPTMYIEHNWSDKIPPRDGVLITFRFLYRERTLDGQSSV